VPRPIHIYRPTLIQIVLAPEQWNLSEGGESDEPQGPKDMVCIIIYVEIDALRVLSETSLPFFSSCHARSRLGRLLKRVVVDQLFSLVREQVKSKKLGIF